MNKNIVELLSELSGAVDVPATDEELVVLAELMKQVVDDAAGIYVGAEATWVETEQGMHIMIVAGDPLAMVWQTSNTVSRKPRWMHHMLTVGRSHPYDSLEAAKAAADEAHRATVATLQDPTLRTLLGLL